MCEAAAQLASYYAGKYHAIDRMVGLGGLEEVRFRDVVRPGNRFVIVSRLLKPRRAITTCEFQCFVNRGLVCEDILKGGGSADGFVGPPVPVSGPPRRKATQRVSAYRQWRLGRGPPAIPALCEK